MKQGYYFWRVEKNDTLSGIAKDAFSLNSPGEVAKKVRELRALNPHLRDPDRIFPGQVITLGSPTAAFNPHPVYASDMRELEELLGDDSPEVDFLFDHWPELQALIEHETQNAVCWAPSGATKSENEWLMYGYRALKSANRTAKAVVDGKLGNLTQVPATVWREIEGEVVHGLQKSVRYVRQADGALGLVARGTRALGIRAGKVILVNPNPQGGLQTFSSTVRAGKNLARWLLKPAGKIFRILDFAQFAHKVVNAWGKPDRARQITGEVAAYTAGLATAEVVASTGSLCVGLVAMPPPFGVAAPIGCYFAVVFFGPKIISDVSKGAGRMAADLIYRSPETIPLGGN